MGKSKGQIVIVLLLAAALVISGCSTVPDTREEKNVLSAQVEETAASFRTSDTGQSHEISL